jgi:hypothetical protein
MPESGIDLRRFCGPNGAREFLRQPWAEDGHAFASNGYIGIMVRDGTAEKMPLPGGQMPGKIPAIIASTSGHDTELTIVLPTSADKPCRVCDGSGSVLGHECEDCEGEGDLWHGNHTYECRGCDGLGRITQPAQPGAPGAAACTNCMGTGCTPNYVQLTHGRYRLHLSGALSAHYPETARSQTPRFERSAGYSPLRVRRRRWRPNAMPRLMPQALGSHGPVPTANPPRRRRDAGG